LLGKGRREEGERTVEGKDGDLAVRGGASEDGAEFVRSPSDGIDCRERIEGGRGGERGKRRGK
jgi:hypothetical protein